MKSKEATDVMGLFMRLEINIGRLSERETR